MHNTSPAQAALLAYAAACRAGATTVIAVDVALARYRSFLPLASEREIRDVLAHALARKSLIDLTSVVRPGVCRGRVTAALLSGGPASVCVLPVADD